MAFEDLPDTILQLVVARLALLDAVALSCTSAKLHRQIAGPGQYCQQQQQQVHLCAAAARQRRQVAATGAWRDELLLTAWQQQQIMAAAGSTAATKKRDPCCDNGLLQCGLGLGFTEATRTKGIMQQQALVDFSGFFMPAPAMLDTTSSFMTDGSASALARTRHNSSSSPDCTTSSSARFGWSGQGLAVSSNPTHNVQHLEQESQQQVSACKLPSCDQTTLHQQLQLVKGHLPPWPRASGGSCSHLMRLGPQQQLAQAAEPCNPVADVLNSCMTDSRGLQQLQHYLQHWKQREAQERLQHILDTLKATTHEPGSEQVTDNQKGPLHLLLLPIPAPPGSIAGLNYPWPPVLQPGPLAYNADRGLHTDHSLHWPMIHQETAVTIRGPSRAFGGSIQPINVLKDVLSPAFWASLQHLDLSGVILSDSDIADLLATCKQLKTLSVAGTAAADMVFLTLSMPASGVRASTCKRQGPWAGGGAAETRMRALRSSLTASLSVTRQQVGQCATTTRMAWTADGRSSKGLKSAFEQPPVLTPCGAPPSALADLRQLIVLDVSGCAGLQSATSTDACSWHVRKALGCLPHLRVLLACRIHVDGALQAHTSATDSTCSGITAPEGRAQLQEASQVTRLLLATLGRLTELDISGATYLTVECMAHLLRTCSRLKKLGVAGCTTLAAKGGTSRLQESLLQMAEQHQVQEMSLTSSSGTPAASQCCSAAQGEEAPRLQQQIAALCLRSQQLQQPVQNASCGQQKPVRQMQVADGQQVNAGDSDRPCTTAPSELEGVDPAAGGSALRLPRLTHLSVGWGWSAASIAALARQSDCLTSFNAGVGSCVTDSLLEVLANSCHHLQHVKLSLCTVSSKGMRALLVSCKKLTSLQMQQCVGPFAMTDMLQPSQRQQQHHWQLSTLHLDGPSLSCTDSQLLLLLGIKRQQQVIQSTPSHRPAWPALTSLSLVRVSGLTDGLLDQLAAAGCQLQHLRLEECCTALSSSIVSTGFDSERPHIHQQQTAGNAGSKTETGGNRFCTAAVSASFSQAALLHLLRQSCRLSLRSLQIRHAAAPLTVDIVKLAVAAAPLLQRLVLDACDLPEKGRVEFEPGSHAALQAIHVVRCQELSEPLSAEGIHSKAQERHATHKHSHSHEQQQQQGGSGTTKMQAGSEGPGYGSSQNMQQTTGWARRCDKQLIVHLLHVGRSLHLHP